VVSTGDEHWTKVLQANDALGKLPVCPYHGKKLPLRCAFNDDAKSTTAAGEDQLGDAGACTADDHPPGGLSMSGETGKERGAGLTTLFDRFCQWLSDARRQSSLLRLPLPKSRSRRSSSLRRGVGGPDDSRAGRRRHSRRRRCNSASPSSSSHGDINDTAAHGAADASRATSTCSSVTTVTSTSAYSDANSETGNSGGDVNSRTGSAELDVYVRSHHRVTSACSGYDVSSSVDVVGKRDAVKDQYCSLISTWPSATGKPSQCTHLCQTCHNAAAYVQCAEL